MQNTIITSPVIRYALLSELWYKKGINVSQIINILLVKVIITEFDGILNRNALEDLRSAFSREYELELPILTINNMLLNTQDYVKRINGTFTVSQDLFEEDFGHAFSMDFQSSFNEISVKVVKFIENKYGIKETYAHVSEGLKLFVEKQSLSILGGHHESNEMLALTNDKIHLYIADYLSEVPDRSAEILSQYVIGQVLFQVIQGKVQQCDSQDEVGEGYISGCVVVLDTPILIPLVGASDQAHQNMYRELVEIVMSSGGKVVTFSHIINETLNILNAARLSLSSNNRYKGELNRVAKYFQRNAKGRQHLYFLCTNLEDYVKKELNIDIVDYKYGLQVQYNLDNKILDKIILDIYRDDNNEEYFSELRFSQPIATDIKSINAIQCLRNGIVPRRPSDYKFIFLTKNWGLVKATIQYSEVEGNEDIRWTVIIDSYLCGLLWCIANKNKISSFCKDKLIADAISIVSPNARFIKEFYEVVKEYAKHQSLGEAAIQRFLMETEIAKSVYVTSKGCLDHSCIYESIDEYEKRVKAQIEKPHIEEKEELKRSNEEMEKQLEKLRRSNEQSETEMEKIRESQNESRHRVARFIHRKEGLRIFVRFCSQKIFIIVLVTSIISGMATFAVDFYSRSTGMILRYLFFFLVVFVIPIGTFILDKIEILGFKSYQKVKSDYTEKRLIDFF